MLLTDPVLFLLPAACTHAHGYSGTQDRVTYTAQRFSQLLSETSLINFSELNAITTKAKED